VAEAQWSEGTTAAEYLSDLRAAARRPDAALAVYSRRGGNLASTIARTADVLKPDRLGPSSLPWLIVVYSADWGALVSGYQFSTAAEISIPAEALWLK
jgi:hypothetical protein